MRNTAMDRPRGFATVRARCATFVMPRKDRKKWQTATDPVETRELAAAPDPVAARDLAAVPDPEGARELAAATNLEIQENSKENYVIKSHPRGKEEGRERQSLKGPVGRSGKPHGAPGSPSRDATRNTGIYPILHV